MWIPLLIMCFSKYVKTRPKCQQYFKNYFLKINNNFNAKVVQKMNYMLLFHKIKIKSLFV